MTSRPDPARRQTNIATNIEAILDLGLSATKATRQRWQSYATIIGIVAFCLGMIVRGWLG